MVADHNMAVDTADRAIEVRAEHALDQERLKQYLAEHLPAGDGSGDLSLAQFDAGQSNPTYLVSFSGKRYVLRKKPPGKLPNIHREAPTNVRQNRLQTLTGNVVFLNFKVKFVVATSMLPFTFSQQTALYFIIV